MQNIHFRLGSESSGSNLVYMLNSTAPWIFKPYLMEINHAPLRAPPEWVKWHFPTEALIMKFPCPL